VNVCPTTIDLDVDGNDWLLDAARRAGIPPERIVIEVTERSGARTASLIKTLARIRSQGFKLALDDVGSGNSGLATLREVAVEFVKIDRSIVLAAPTEPGARGILMAMATYARQTGAFVIAEGIEDAEVLAFLRRIGRNDLQQNAIIQGGQGFGLGRPAAGAPAAERAEDSSLPQAA
jgi:EAL domain-containing protein (putative c-di-GMP-specific phosphodiesterase class I)